MTSSEPHDAEPTTGSVALIEQPTEPTAGAQLLAELATDESPIEPTDKPLHALGCIVSALALHIPADQWSSVALLRPPAEHGAQIEIRCGSVEAAAAVVEALPWPNGTTFSTAVGNSSTHYVTSGLLWGFRVAVVGLEPLGGES